MIELWKDIEGWEGLYQVSNKGRIKSVRRNKVKVLDTNSSGYIRVQLCDNKRRKKVSVHRLVATAFVQGYFEGAVVNHKDLDRTNNCSDNLEWCTPSDNQRHAIRMRGFLPSYFKKVPYQLTFPNGSVLFFDDLKACSRSVGLSRSTLYSRLKEKNGYLVEVDAVLSRCNA